MSQTLSPDQVKESKSVATDRLRNEGRWNEASLFKDEAIKRLRAEGRTRSEASEAAWDEMLAKFPPLPAPPTAPDPLDLADADDSVIERLAAVPVDFERDVHWVYTNLEHPRIRLDAAPSLAAWGLLRTARSNPAKFHTQLIAMQSKAKAAAPTEDDEPPDSDPGLADLRRMIAAMDAG